MKRWLFKVGLLLLLGAIVNVAVAWGCVCLSGTDYEQEFARDSWPLFTPDGWPEQPVMAWESIGCGISVEMMDANGPQPIHSDEADIGPWNADLYRFARFAVGWPSRSMQWSLYDMMPDPSGPLNYFPTKAHGTFVSGLDCPFGPDDEWRFQRRWPLMPLWPSFAINTVFYAAVLWVLFAFPFALRRLIRVRRGQCPVCGYPFGLSKVCTECGKPLDGLRAARHRSLIMKILFVGIALSTLAVGGCSRFTYQPHQFLVTDESTQRPISGAQISVDYTLPCPGTGFFKATPPHRASGRTDPSGLATLNVVPDWSWTTIAVEAGNHARSEIFVRSSQWPEAIALKPSE